MYLFALVVVEHLCFDLVTKRLAERGCLVLVRDQVFLFFF